MTRATALVSILFLISACTAADDHLTDASTTTPRQSGDVVATAPTQPLGNSGTSESLAPDVTRGWVPGTLTCAELDRDYPEAADDHRLLLDDGLVSFSYAEGTDSTREELVQFVDDTTCDSDSPAWTYTIVPLLDAEALHRSGQLCSFYRQLQNADPSPASARDLLVHLSAAEDLCR